MVKLSMEYRVPVARGRGASLDDVRKEPVGRKSLLLFSSGGATPQRGVKEEEGEGILAQLQGLQRKVTA